MSRQSTTAPVGGVGGEGSDKAGVGAESERRQEGVSPLKEGQGDEGGDRAVRLEKAWATASTQYALEGVATKVDESGGGGGGADGEGEEEEGEEAGEVVGGGGGGVESGSEGGGGGGVDGGGEEQEGEDEGASMSSSSTTRKAPSSSS